MTVTKPMLPVHRSLLHRWHTRRGANFVTLNGRTFVDNYGDVDAETNALGKLGICDLSLLRRHGITGPGSKDWLRAHQQTFTTVPNTSARLASGDLLARLSEHEFMHIQLTDLDDGLRNSDEEVWLGDHVSRAYPLPRGDSHCMFSVSGRSVADMFSKLCAVDLRREKFSSGNVAQTSIARVDAIVMREDIADTSNFFMLASTSTAEYLWECLVDAMEEYDGQAVGIAALRALEKGSAP